jgi:NADPH:quinone reductase-like Zn-dependent oxidoreductase
LIKIRAASVNPLDWHLMRGTPYPIRLSGLRRPKEIRLGVDVAGQVETAGKDVTEFRPGDEVFGSCRGAFAEYVCTPQSALVMKPENVTFAQAAAAPVAGFTALQGLRDKGHIQAGQKVLINGAAGGVGTFAVQVAKSFGAEVTGVCSSRNVEMVCSLGADRVIDHTQQDFTQSDRQYDLLFDCIANHSLSAVRRVLKTKGTYVVISGPDGRWLGSITPMIKALLLNPFVSQNLTPCGAKSRKEDLAILRELMLTGKVTPVIDRCYQLSETPEAIRYLEEGHARGKVIITLEQPDSLD